MKLPVASSVSLFSALLTFSSLHPGLNGVKATDLTSHKSAISEDADLVSFLSTKPTRHDSIFTEAIQLLESMKSSPSCNRIAATRLVTSCQSIGGKTDDIETDTHVALDNIRSLYAARLAICELNGAGTATPSPCLPVTVLPSPKKGFLGFSNKYKPQVNIADNIPADLLEPCLKSLESRPQWWTSYSNSRQNAVVICQASRIESEKEELLELHRFVAESTLKLNRGLQEALRMAAEGSAQHKAFMDMITNMRDKLAHEWEESESIFKRAIATLLNDVESRVDSAVKGVASIFAEAQMEAAVFEKGIRNASAEVENLQRILQAVHDETLTRNEQLIETHQQDALMYHELSSSLQSSLTSLLQHDVARVSQGVASFDTLLEWLSARMHLILEQETEVSKRLRNFEESLGESERKAENLRQEQKLQSEAFAVQSRAQESLQLSIEISQALLDKAAASASNLQVMVEDAVSKYTDLPIFTGPWGQHSAWTVSAVLFSIIGALNPRVALAVLFIGSIHFIATRILR